jgi:precorrin-6A synthase
MRTLLIIGIGAGNPEHLTVQAINALQRVDVFFLTDKGQDKEDLKQLRTDICARYIPSPRYRTIEVRDPERDRAPADYKEAVQAWHEQRAALYEALIRDHLADNECGAFLVWGDPSVYDSTLRLIGQLASRGGVEFQYEVIPGISSVQALAARHRIALNQIGEPVQITTGRRFAENPATLAVTDTVVMLDGECAFRQVTDEEVEIFWAAYLGTPAEIVLSGPLARVGPTIERARTDARRQHGWIMDTYLLRKPRR